MQKNERYRINSEFYTFANNPNADITRIIKVRICDNAMAHGLFPQYLVEDLDSKETFMVYHKYLHNSRKEAMQHARVIVKREINTLYDRMNEQYEVIRKKKGYIKHYRKQCENLERAIEKDPINEDYNEDIELDVEEPNEDSN